MTHLLKHCHFHIFLDLSRFFAVFSSLFHYFTLFLLLSLFRSILSFLFFFYLYLPQSLFLGRRLFSIGQSLIRSSVFSLIYLLILLTCSFTRCSMNDWSCKIATNRIKLVFRCIYLQSLSSHFDIITLTRTRIEREAKSVSIFQTERQLDYDYDEKMLQYWQMQWHSCISVWAIMLYDRHIRSSHTYNKWVYDQFVSQIKWINKLKKKSKMDHNSNCR